jgi:hypothetical protein
MRRHVQALAGLVAASSILVAQEEFVPLFNGKDLAGWVNINCAPQTFTAQTGMIHTTGKPICEIRTNRMFENFVLELEWQHVNAGGNAGVFVWADALPARGQPFLRAVEVQVLEGRESENYTSHGDVFAIHGAKLTPDRPHPQGWMRSLPREKRARPAGEWNHYRITCANGRITLAVNGKEVSGGYGVTPRKGYIALEAEGSPALFRNIRIRELPPSGSLTESQIAQADQGFVSLYTGLDLTGWQASPDGAWTAEDWILKHEDGAAKSAFLVNEREYADFELMADWRLSKDSALDAARADRHRPPPSGVRAVIRAAVDADTPRGDWHRTVARVVGDRVTTTIDGRTVMNNHRQPGRPRRGRVALSADEGAEFANIFVRELK